MIKLCLDKVFNYLFTLIFITLVSYLMAFLLAGDWQANLVGQAGLQDDTYANLLHSDNPISGFIAYVELLIAGQWGYNLHSDSLIIDDVLLALPATIELMLSVLLLTLMFGIPFGLVNAFGFGKRVNTMINGLATFWYSLPTYWFALVMIMVFAIYYPIFPMSGRLSPIFELSHQTGFIFWDIYQANHIDRWAAFKDALAHLILPAFSVSIFSIALMTRSLNRSVQQVMQEDYILLAETRGLSASVIFFRHILRNALLPVMPILAFLISTSLTQIILIETIFSWPGLGAWLVAALQNQDYTAIRVGIWTIAVLVVTLTTLLDLLALILTPSLRKSKYV